MRRVSTLVAFAIVLCGVLSACNKSTKPLPPGDDILFIGNSLTYYNDMPEILQALVDSTRQAGEVRDVTFGDYALIDHWREGTSREMIGRGGWKYVILQQGPSSVSYNRDSLRLLTDMFDKRIRAVGATTALYSVWPMLSRQQDFSAAIESYRLAAQDVNGLMLPVASAWENVFALEAGIALYDDGGLHPTVEGSYLAAIVIYARLFDVTPVGLPVAMTLRSGGSVTIPNGTAMLLQQAAADAIANVSAPTPPIGTRP